MTPSIKEKSKKLLFFTKHLLLQLFFAFGSILMLLGVWGVDKKLNKFLDTIINPKFFETLKANKLMFGIAIATFAVLFSYYIVKAIYNAMNYDKIHTNIFQSNTNSLKWYQKQDTSNGRENLLHESRQGFMVPIWLFRQTTRLPAHKRLSAISQLIVHSAIGCIFAVLITDLVQTFRGAKPIFNILPEFLTQSDIGLKVFAAIVVAFAALFIVNTIIDIVNIFNFKNNEPIIKRVEEIFITVPKMLYDSCYNKNNNKNNENDNKNDNDVNGTINLGKNSNIEIVY